MFDFSLFEGLKYDLAEIAFWGAISDFEYIAVVLNDARRATECGWHIIAVIMIRLLQLSGSTLLNAGHRLRRAKTEDAIVGVAGDAGVEGLQIGTQAGYDIDFDVANFRKLVFLSGIVFYSKGLYSSVQIGLTLCLEVGYHLRWAVGFVNRDDIAEVQALDKLSKVLAGDESASE
jgi:hypothetical protein